MIVKELIDCLQDLPRHKWELRVYDTSGSEIIDVLVEQEDDDEFITLETS